MGFESENEKYKEILRRFLTNRETVEELAAIGKKEISEAEKKTGFWAKFRKK